MTARPPARAVFFDIGNVLLRFSARRVLLKVSWAMRLNPIRVARYMWRSDVGARVELGEMGEEELLAVFRAKLGYRGSGARFRALWCDHFSLDRRAYALYKSVSARAPVYLLSNTNKLHIDFIRRRYAFPALAKGAILSHELGLRKPDPAIYRAALRLSQTKPEETVFIDDLPANVEAASRMGLVALRWRGAADMRPRLAELGLLPR